jgi:replicative DNA helicase
MLLKDPDIKDLFNTELESDLMKLIVQKPTVLNDIGLHYLNRTDFYDPVMGHCYDYARDRFIENVPFSQPLMYDHVKYINEILYEKNLRNIVLNLAGDGTPLPIKNFNYAPEYARRIKEFSDKRQIVSVLFSTIEKTSKDPSATPEELATRSVKQIQVILDEDNGDFLNCKILGEQLYAKLELNKYLPDDELSVIPSGFLALDNITGGFQRSDLIILGGRTGMGKTALAVTMALNMAEPSQREAYMDMRAFNIPFASLEMSNEQITQRLVCSIGRFDLKELRTAKPSSKQQSARENAFNIFSKLPIFISDKAGLSPLKIRQYMTTLRARLEKTGKDIDAVFIDYLQLVRPTEKHSSREQAVSEISGELKMIAKDFNIPVFALAQLRRPDKYTTTNQDPEITDLRESGAIEQDADIVMFIVKGNPKGGGKKPDAKTGIILPDNVKEIGNDGEDDEDFDDPDDNDKTGVKLGKEYEQAKLLIMKHRNGSVGKVKLKFLKKSAKFLPL